MFEHGYALLIGVNESKKPALALEVVGKDVQALHAVLTDPAYCGYPVANTKVVTGPEATASGIMAGLDWLKTKLDADPDENQTAVIYYSGHGHREANGEAYLLPYDVRSPFRDWGLAAKKLAAAIAAIQPRRLLVVLDCCHAGAVGAKDPDDTTLDELTSVAITKGDGFDVLGQGEARVVLSSSRGEQKSYIRKDQTMSIFTHHLVEALTGHAAGAELGVVTAAQLMDHVGAYVPPSAKSEYGVDQEPSFVYQGTTFPIAEVLGRAGVAKGAEPPAATAVVKAVLNAATVAGRLVNVKINAKGGAGPNVDATTNVDSVTATGEVIGVEWNG
jgi:hypothetical protein